MRFSAKKRVGPLFGSALFLLCLASGAAGLAQPAGGTAQDITRQALLPGRGKAGRPLPLAASWSSGQKPGGFTPDFQMAMIKRGYHLLPWFYLPPPGWAFKSKYYETAIRQAAKLHLPISFLGTQWESLLGELPQYRGLPSNINPNVRATLGRAIPEVSPFGPARLWRRVGEQWTSTPLVEKLQQWYPDPPLVLFVSNNEQPRLWWWEAGESNRFVARYGGAGSDEFKRGVIGDAWIERYRSMENGMRRELISKDWKKKAQFIGFNAFGSFNFGRSQDWIRESLCIPERFEPWPVAWDGASAQYYVMDTRSPLTDYTVLSPQIEAMSYVFMLKEARRLNPGFWFELSVWDGHESPPSLDKRLFYASKGQTFTPARYAGMVKFGMWLLRPRLVRDYRSWEDTVKNSGAYFLAVADSVEMVYRDPVLRKFWRFGRLVENTGGQNPFQANIPKDCRKAPRWFLLGTDLDPPGPWTISTELPVFALALVLGERPARQWLVYAHSPLLTRKNVEIRIPGYGSIHVSAAESGSFYLVMEKTGEVRPLQ